MPSKTLYVICIYNSTVHISFCFSVRSIILVKYDQQGTGGNSRSPVKSFVPIGTMVIITLSHLMGVQGNNQTVTAKLLAFLKNEKSSLFLFDGEGSARLLTMFMLPGLFSFALSSNLFELYSFLWYYNYYYTCSLRQHWIYLLYFLFSPVYHSLGSRGHINFRPLVSISVTIFLLHNQFQQYETAEIHTQKFSQIISL